MVSKAISDNAAYVAQTAQVSFDAVSTSISDNAAYVSQVAQVSFDAVSTSVSDNVASVVESTKSYLGMEVVSVAEQAVNESMVNVAGSTVYGIMIEPIRTYPICGLSKSDIGEYVWTMCGSPSAAPSLYDVASGLIDNLSSFVVGVNFISGSDFTI